jgi:hypothetical protein
MQYNTIQYSNIHTHYIFIHACSTAICTKRYFSKFFVSQSKRFWTALHTNLCASFHSCIHTYIHTYIHLHKHILHSYILAKRLRSIALSARTYIHTYMWPTIYTLLSTLTHTYTQIGVCYSNQILHTHAYIHTDWWPIIQIRFFTLTHTYTQIGGLLFTLAKYHESETRKHRLSGDFWAWCMNLVGLKVILWQRQRSSLKKASTL